jgi:hypothetical protein
LPEILQAHEHGRSGPKGVLLQDALVQRLSGGPEEEHQDDGHLWGDQQPGQPGGSEEDALFHTLSSAEAKHPLALSTRGWG